MRLEDRCEVGVPVEDAWTLLMDVPRVIPCMPGATLVDTVDERNWKAQMAVKLGPISLTFNVDVERTEVDEEGRAIALAANAREARNRGRARAAVRVSLHAVDPRTTAIAIDTDLALMGAVAQYGGGMVEEVSSEMVRAFAANLEATLLGRDASAPTAGAAASAAAAPADAGAAAPQPAAAPAPVVAGGGELSVGRLLRAALRGRLARLRRQIAAFRATR